MYWSLECEALVNVVPELLIAPGEKKIVADINSRRSAEHLDHIHLYTEFGVRLSKSLVVKDY